MVGQLDKYREQLTKDVGARDALISQKDALVKERDLLNEELISATEAQEVMRIVAQKTQENIQYHISGLVTTAQESIFPDPYQFVAEFVQRRDKTECDFFFQKDGEKFSPFSSSGGGTIDVASFALRLVALTLSTNRRTLLLDESFKFVSVNYQSRCSEMLKSLSEKLGLQIIMVSHLPAIIDSADKVFTIEKGSLVNVSTT